MKKYKIEATLRYGKYTSKSAYGFAWFSLVLSIVGIVVFVLAYIWDRERIYIVTLFILPIPLLIASVWIVIVHGKIMKQIAEWQLDAVELEAKCIKAYGFTTLLNGHPSSMSVPKLGTAKIEVSFIYKEKAVKKVSGDPNKQYNALNGYDKIFAKYENKRLRILYSPKYDEVMILSISPSEEINL